MMPVRSHQILVVEDDLEIRDSLLEVLTDAGYWPVGVGNGQQALALLRAASEPPCLILLDLMMPHMDGMTFRQKQMQDAHIAAIPVVVISAYRNVAETARALQVTHHLRKPLDLDELLALIRVYCPDPTAPAAVG